MDQTQFASFIRYRGPNVTARQSLFEQANADLESAFAAYLAQPPVDFDDDAYIEANNKAREALDRLTASLGRLAPCDDDRRLMRDLINQGGMEAARRAESVVRAEWQSASNYAVALVEIRTWVNLAILADLWPQQ